MVCEWVSDCYLTSSEQLFSHIMARTRWWWCPFYTRSTCLVGYFNSASSPRQQSMGRHVASLGHIFLILSQPVLALTLNCRVLNGVSTNTCTNFIVSGLCRLGLEPILYSHSRGACYPVTPPMWSLTLGDAAFV